MKLFKSFLIILGVGMISSLIPFLHISLVFGFPAVLLSSILVTLIFRKELGE